MCSTEIAQEAGEWRLLPVHKIIFAHRTAFEPDMKTGFDNVGAAFRARALGGRIALYNHRR